MNDKEATVKCLPILFICIPMWALLNILSIGVHFVRINKEPNFWHILVVGNFTMAGTVAVLCAMYYAAFNLTGRK